MVLLMHILKQLLYSHVHMQQKVNKKQVSHLVIKQFMNEFISHTCGYEDSRIAK